MVDGIKFNAASFNANGNFFLDANNQEKYKNVFAHLQNNEQYISLDGAKNGEIDNVEITNFISHIDKGEDGKAGDGVITDTELVNWAEGNNQEFHKNLTKSSFNELKNFLYALMGNKVETGELDINADGVMDNGSRVTDSDGKALYESWDYGADGVQDLNLNFKYDQNGNLLTQTLQERLDANGNSVKDGVQTTTFDGNNNTLEQFTVYDKNEDGKLDQVVQNIFDDKGNIAYNMVENLDEAGNTTDTKISYSSYADDGSHVMETQFDSNGDGIADNLTTTSFDKSGNPLLQSIDSDGDGNYDSITSYSYNADGSVTTLAQFDKNDDGKFDAAGMFNYDSQMRMKEAFFDEDLDGKLDSKLTYEYDENGNQNVTRTEINKK
ncbi:hypothetical protein IJC60_01275 [bacterium]|nr:hypothetical protein [bacterium]